VKLQLPKNWLQFVYAGAASYFASLMASLLFVGTLAGVILKGQSVSTFPLVAQGVLLANGGTAHLGMSGMSSLGGDFHFALPAVFAIGLLAVFFIRRRTKITYGLSKDELLVGGGVLTLVFAILAALVPAILPFTFNSIEVTTSPLVPFLVIAVSSILVFNWSEVTTKLTETIKKTLATAGLFFGTSWVVLSVGVFFTVLFLANDKNMPGELAFAASGVGGFLGLAAALGVSIPLSLSFGGFSGTGGAELNIGNTPQLLIATIVVLALISLTSVFVQGTRGSRAATRAEQGLTVATFAVIGLGIQLFETVSVSGLMSAGIGVSLPAYSFIIFAIMGALVELSAYYLEPHIVRLLPGTKKLVALGAGERSASAKTSSNAGPQERKPLSAKGKKVLILSAAVAGTGIVLGALVGVLQSTVFGPGSTAQSYMSNIADGKFGGAASLLKDEPSNDMLLTDEVGATVTNRITDLVIGDVVATENSAYANATYSQAGEEHQVTISLEKVGSKMFFFDDWRVASPTPSGISISNFEGRAGAQLTVGSTNAGEISAENTNVLAFPGNYKLKIGESEYLSATEADAVVRFEGTTSVRLTDTLNASGLAKAQEAIDTWLTACVESDALNDYGCPFENLTGLWREYDATHDIVKDAVVAISSELPAQVTTTTPGEVSANWTESFIFNETKQSGKDTFLVEGTIEFVDGGLVFESNNY
jgi:hypothetical protein